MSEPGAAPRPDTSDMFAVHGVFRDTLGAAPTLVGGIAPDDAERVALIANYYENILSFLESHHDGEEVLVFPLLRERCDGADALIDHMDEQHHEALALLQ
jgi:iron-sulfur cluster repair protein YtfE (RIC family)